MKKIFIVISTPMTVKAFLLKHIDTLSKEYEITIVSNSNLDLSQEYKIKCLSKYIPLNRKINFLEDSVLFNDNKSFNMSSKFYIKDISYKNIEEELTC